MVQVGRPQYYPSPRKLSHDTQAGSFAARVYLQFKWLYLRLLHRVLKDEGERVATIDCRLTRLEQFAGTGRMTGHQGLFVRVQYKYSLHNAELYSRR